jgi:hypothetical protein
MIVSFQLHRRHLAELVTQWRLGGVRLQALQTKHRNLGCLVEDLGMGMGCLSQVDCEEAR